MTLTPLDVLLVADVSPLQRAGGGARVLKEQARGLARRGHRPCVLARAPRDEVPARGELDGAAVLHYPVRRSGAVAYGVDSLLGARRAFRRELAARAWSAALFHQPFSAAALVGRLGAATPKAYVFLSPAGIERRIRARAERRPPGLAVRLQAAILRALEGRALAACERIVVLSEYCRRLLAAEHPSVRAPVETIPGGVDVEHFRPAPDRAALRRRLGLPDDRAVLLTVRDLQPRMGLDTFVDALRRLADTPWLALVGGTGPLRDELEGRAAAMGIGDRVRFVGHVPEAELPLYYAAADLFVLPTRELEGFGLVTLEALACGTPVVATPVGATPEILRGLDASLLAEDAAADALAAAIARALPQASRPAFRERCRRYVTSRYRWESHVERLEALLDEIVDRRAFDARLEATAATSEP